MKIIKRNLLSLIENLLFEKPEADDDLNIDMTGYARQVDKKELTKKDLKDKDERIIEKIKKLKVITQGIKKAYQYVDSDNYRPQKIIQKLGNEKFKKFKEEVKNAIRIMGKERNKRIHFVHSDDMENKKALAMLFIHKKDPLEFKMYIVTDMIRKELEPSGDKKLAGEKISDQQFKEKLVDIIFHEMMHIENYYFNQKVNLKSDAQDIMINLNGLTNAFYSKRYTEIERTGLEDALKDYLNPKTESGTDEIRVRISQFKSNNNLGEALKNGSKMSFKDLSKKYGDTDAQWLFLLNYKKYSLDDLEGKMNVMAKLNQGVQKFKA